jgi:hypothetical protein
VTADNGYGTNTASAPQSPPAFIDRLRRTQWVVVPLLLFLVLECTVRFRESSGPVFWDAVEQSLQPGAVHFIFIGSSRVAASIDEKLFEEELSGHRPQPARAINVGTGYSYLLQHYLGLRNALRRHPGPLRGCVVFVETAGGLPEYSTADGSEWYFDGRPDLLIQVLRLEDFPTMWVSTMPLDDKWHVSVRWLTRGSLLLSRGHGVAVRVLAEASEWLGEKIVSVSPGVRGEPPRPADLTTDGGVRTDQAGIALARRFALENARRESSDQRPLGKWTETVLGRIVFLVRQAGGQVVFYEMPLHSVQAAPRRTAIRMDDAAAFRAQAAAWGTPFLLPEFSFTDEDFPDLWHLKRSRARAFTVALAKAWAGYSLE